MGYLSLFLFSKNIKTRQMILSARNKMVLSLEWAFFGKDKKSILLGSIFLGITLSFLIGVPLLLLFREYKVNIPIEYGLILMIIVFSISTYIFYNAGCKKLKK